MRPLTLELRSFTAFRDPQIIDLTDVELFTFWGPTGSGKSSVLDAMTYALYGKVERIGNQIGQLVSQGQPRMSVILTFQAGEDRYRVVRSTPASGSGSGRPKILLEHAEGNEWRSYGEGADRATTVNPTIIDLIGLDYPAFTRAVLLPQGRFAEFLTGDSKERRKILTELLGLELFGRMAESARRIAQEAKAAAEARRSLLESQFAEATPEAVEAAASEAARAQAVVAAAGEVDKELGALLKRWEAHEAVTAQLSECADELGEMAAELDAQAAALDDLVEQAASISELIAATTGMVKQATAAHEAALKARDKAVKAQGSLEDLLDLRAAVRALSGAIAERDRAVATLEETNKDLGSLSAQLEEAAAAIAKATDAQQKSELDATEAEVHLRAAQRADLVGALSKDLAVGDACPVCDRPIEKLKKASPAAIDKATKTLERARKAAEAARVELGKAEQRRAALEGSLQERKTQAKTCSAELERRNSDATALEKKIAGALGKVADPQAAVEERIENLRSLEDTLAAAAAALTEAQAGAADAANTEKEIAARTREVRAAVGSFKPGPLLRRLAKALDDAPVQDPLPKPLPEDTTGLGASVRAAAERLRATVGHAIAQAEQRTGERDQMIETARATVARIVPEGFEVSGRSLPEIVAGADALAKDLEKNATTLEQQLIFLKTQLAQREALEKEVAEQEATRATYHALGLELRGDRIVDYLQGEALVALAAAGSVRLEYLSTGRYRLAFENDEFFVVDAWNGEERRSVRTLSGGETFLASLALALALADEVKNLAVTDKAPIDSLFLDEGFGQLDAESLEVVISAIEQLGGDGRLVGVITHVPELADRIPVRFNITKSPRGSTITRVVTDQALI